MRVNIVNCEGWTHINDHHLLHRDHQDSVFLRLWGVNVAVCHQHRPAPGTQSAWGGGGGERDGLENSIVRATKKEIKAIYNFPENYNFAKIPIKLNFCLP